MPLESRSRMTIGAAGATSHFSPMKRWVQTQRGLNTPAGCSTASQVPNSPQSRPDSSQISTQSD